MAQPSSRPLPLDRPSFLDAPRCTTFDLLDADVAVLGIPFTTPEDLAASRAPSSDAPDAVRQQSLRLAGTLGRYDFDLGGDLLAGRRVTLADCGDVWGLPGRYADNDRQATRAVQAILSGGALPIVLGGDHGAAVSALRAYRGRGPICVVHLGADLDWRDEVNGVRNGPHTAMRRASELPWVTSMIQIGLRAVGSSRRREVEDATAFGSVRVHAEQLHQVGVETVLRRIPEAPGYYISLDATGLDPSIAPGVELPAFGGLTYYEVTNLLKGVAARGHVVGLALVGIVPANDLKGLTSLLGARLLLNVVGALAQAGQVGAGDRRSTLATGRPPLAAARS